MKIRTIITTALLLVFHFSVSTSHPNIFKDGIIKGVIVDSTAEIPLPFANITLHNQKDSSFIGGTASGTNGEFILTNVVEGNYYLKISFLGYSNKFLNGLNISVNDKEYNVGVIKLSHDAIQLQEGQVVGEKAAEELHLDKKVINVSQNLNAAGGTALDVLQNQPSVRVDPDGTVYLRGSSNFTILVNGRPSVLQGSDALRQFAASQIENIELITNPSARYDAEGSAGIININLKAQKDYSLSGILNLNSGTGDKYNGDFSANYNLNGLSLNGGLDYRDNTFTNEQNISRSSLIGNNLLTNVSDINIRNKRKQYSFRGGLDYTINPENSLGLSLSGGLIDIYGSLNTNYVNNQMDNTRYAVIKNKNDVPVKYFNSTFNYQYKINPAINDLNFELTYNFVDINNDQLMFENLSDENFNPFGDFINSTRFINDSKRNEGRSKLNYKHKLSESDALETGLQANYSFRDFELENRIFDNDLQDYIIDPLLTNTFNLRNNVYAGFISFNSEIAGFNYMLGLRSEYMDRTLEQKTLNETFELNRMDLFPSLNISRKIDDHQLQFSYSRRINRPHENLLNPFPFYSDANITTAGNPKLLPEYINSFELNYQKMFGSVFVSAQTYYRKSADSFSQTFSVDSTGRLNITFNNYGNSDVYGAELSGSFSVADIFRFDPSVNLFQTHLDGLVGSQKIEKDYFNWSARLNTTVTISQDTRFQLSGNYMKFIDAQTVSKPFMMISASLRQDFLNKAMSLTLQARNLFNASDMKLNTAGSNFNADALIRPEAPVFTLIFSYNFNNFKRSQRQTDNIDIQTGL
jgi:outer membrane receptor protein involved in Fe transport